MSGPIPDSGPERTRWIADGLALAYSALQSVTSESDDHGLTALREVMAEKQALLEDQLSADLDFGEPE